jgi:CubicO group peptidase (beta-lactamase class C family)
MFFSTGGRIRKRRFCMNTGRCRWSAESLTGLVHDDNCSAMGGVGGHAGLFGSGEGVIAICQAFLDLYHGRETVLPISRETFLKACEPVKDSEWTRGFNLVSPEGSSSGRYFSANSIGHLGFTGVSFWIDLDKQRIVSLLTNRVIKGDDLEGIREMRPELHDAVVRCLEQR